MYDNLVRELQCCPDGEEGCSRCEYRTSLHCRETLMRQAADAIEELQAQIDGWIEQERKALLKSVPKWIPVKERLPEEYTDVLCYYEYFRYGDYNCMFRTIDRGYFGNGRWGGEAGQGCKNKVLAWMPLPVPPKEKIE